MFNIPVEGLCQTNYSKIKHNKTTKITEQFFKYLFCLLSFPSRQPATVFLSRSIATKSLKDLTTISPEPWTPLPCFATSLQNYVVHGQMLLSKVKQVAAGTIQLCYNENMRWLPLHSPALMRTVGGQHHNGLMKTGNGWH